MWNSKHLKENYRRVGEYITAETGDEVKIKIAPKLAGGGKRGRKDKGDNDNESDKDTVVKKAIMQFEMDASGLSGEVQSDPDFMKIIGNMRKMIAAINTEPDSVMSKCLSALDTKSLMKVNKLMSAKNADYIYTGISKVFFNSEFATLSRKTEDITIITRLLVKVTHIAYMARCYDDNSNKILHAKCVEDIGNVFLMMGAHAGAQDTATAAAGAP